jgi:hypothetical protein
MTVGRFKHGGSLVKDKPALPHSVLATGGAEDESGALQDMAASRASTMLENASVASSST